MVWRQITVALVIVLFCTGLAEAGKLTSGLASAFQDRGESELLPVLISLTDTTSASRMAEDLANKAIPLTQIHERVMDTLQTRSAITQSPVMTMLETLSASGSAKDIRAYWIVNAISATLNRVVAETIAGLAEVGEVGLDETITLRRSQSELADGGAEGLSATGALQVWLNGTRGEGRIVCVIGDGHGLNHPALSENWRGKSAPSGECWFDAAGGTSPSSCGSESVYLLGLMCGAPQGSNPAVGIAPAAQWITASVFCGGETRLSNILAACQWAADPDGNSRTMDDVPDAICNAWGESAACMGSEPQSVWQFVSNLEALGPLPVFAVNQDSNASAPTVTSPESHSECFSVGNVDLKDGSPTINSSSGSGPSACDPQITKPDIVAPGTTVRTTGETDYVQVTGSGAAAAYVAGAAALIRQSNPMLTAAAIKNILTSSAKDLGTAGPDNTFGFGMLDAAKAISLAGTVAPTGMIRVLVRSDGNPVSGARVSLIGAGENYTVTSEKGEAEFSRVIAGKKYALGVGRFGYGYYSHHDSVNVEKGKTISVSVNLESGFADDAEHDQGWSLGVKGDDATSGIWMRDIPVGSTVNGRPVQPDRDASSEGKFCFVTGNAASKDAEASEADVDGGRTTLRSPLFSLVGLESPELHFSYWFSNDQGTNPGQDSFRAQISSNGGATWKDILSTASSTNGWTSVSYKINDYAASTDPMLLQFIAEDEDPGSLVEAAVDEIRISAESSAPPAPENLTLDVQFNQVILKWDRSEGAAAYRVYLSDDPEHTVKPGNLYATLPDTILTIPMSDIPYSQFYFQVTAVR